MIKSGATGDSDSDQELFGYVLLFLIFVGPLFIFWNLFGDSITAYFCGAKKGVEAKKTKKELENEAHDKKHLDEAAAKFEKRKLKIKEAKKLKKKEAKAKKAAAAAEAAANGGLPPGGGQLVVAPPYKANTNNGAPMVKSSQSPLQQAQPMGAAGPMNGAAPVHEHEHLQHLHHHGHQHHHGTHHHHGHHHHHAKVHVPHTKKARHEQRRQRLAEQKAAGTRRAYLIARIFLFF